jgi:tetratricopeptide (TPR) repeat protein
MVKYFSLILLVTLAPTIALAMSQEGQPSQAPLAHQLLSTTDTALESIIKASDAAWANRDFDEAIRLCEQGISLSPKEPAFWANKAAALIQRGIAVHNAALYQADEALKKAKLTASRKDFRDALETATRALELVKLVPMPSEPALISVYEMHQRWALRMKAQALFLITTFVDPSYAASGLVAFRDYVDAETDPAEKLQGQLHAGQLMLFANEYPEAFDEYQRILLNDAENLDAILGAAISLLNLGYLTNDKAAQQQGIDYLAQFVKKAPEKHRLRGSAEEALDYLRTSDPFAGRTIDAIGTRAPEAANSPVERELNSGVLNGRAVNLPKPPFPLIARFARAQGTVVVKVLLDEEGNVIEAHAEAGHPLLRAVSVAAAREAKFSPTRISNHPVKVAGVITYNFVAE